MPATRCRASRASAPYNKRVKTLQRISIHFWVAAGIAAVLAAPALVAQETSGASKRSKQTAKEQPPTKEQTEEQDLQKAVEAAGNDRAALVKNLEAFLKTHPDSSLRTQIYRAIVEASLKVEDNARAMDYAERMVALRPDDPSINVLAIQLLERHGDAAGWRRATSYCTRVLEQVERSPVADKSPRMSVESWEKDKKRDEASVILVRGRLYQKLNDLPAAQKDYEASYGLQPTAMAAVKLAEIAELRKDPTEAIREYARAFALAGDNSGALGRAELRKKIGNTWRLAHGSEDGLGEYLLRVFDDAATSGAPTKPVRNAGVKNPFEFVLRRAPGGAPFPLADTKGKVVVLNFWATWCGPCRELEPHFEKIAAKYAGDKDIQFFALNCDDDETLVGPYLEEEKPKTAVLFADNLETYFAVSSFPTTVILGRDGKTAFRTDGFDPDTVEKTLVEAIERARRKE